MFKITIRRCSGNRDAWGAFRDGVDPANYGYCCGTSYSIPALLDHVYRTYGPAADVTIDVNA